PPTVAETAEPHFPNRCAEDDVVVSIAGSDAATGSRYLFLRVRNQSSTPCVLDGLPDLAFASMDGNEIHPVITPRTRPATGDELPAGPITLKPDSAAWADLVWHAPTGRPVETTVLMAPWAGAVRTVDTEILDIVDGVEMGLTRWYIRH